MAEEKTRIIIKRIKSSHDDEEHGGAWKVAYADFMTAMMAFFLLLWLLSLSEEDKLTGIAEYFSQPEVALTSFGGVDILTGEVLLETEKKEFEDTVKTPSDIEVAEEEDAAAVPGGVRNPWVVLEEGKDQPAAAPDNIDDASSAIASLFVKGGKLDDMGGNVKIIETETSLIIEIFEVDGSPLFASGSADLTDANFRILNGIAPQIAGLSELITITGHTDGTAYRGNGSYSNWELSGDRANATRKSLTGLGIADDRIVRVSGAADRALMNEEDASASENRRVTIELLRRVEK